MIRVDDRVGSRELLDHLPKGSAEMVRLEYADAAFEVENEEDGLVRVGVERKTIRDLMASIRTGRLSGHQLIGLAEHYERVWLLVEGAWRPNPRDGLLQVRGKNGGWYTLELGSSRFMAREMHGYLNTLSQVCGVYVMYTLDLKHSARWLFDLYKWWNKGPLSSHNAHRAFDNSQETAQLVKPPLVARVAKELPGVGMKKSLRIAGAVPSVFDLALVSRETLLGVEGIGPKLADGIIRAINGSRR